MPDGLTYQWIDPPAVTVPRALANAVGGHPLVARTLVRRGLAEVDAALAFLDPQYHRPTSPFALPGADQAVARLRRAIERGERICVWGDFDVDGQTATTLLVLGLRELGAHVVYHIPVRASESHGINVPRVAAVIDEGARLIVTCDTGISAHDPITYAREHGVETIVTDHHELPATLPPAVAVLNPKMLPHDHPLRELSGVGCAYKLAEALYTDFARPDRADQYLDLVALGLVADLAVLTGDTRYLLQRGLAALRHTERLGLQALMETADLDPQWLTEEHIAFVLAPRLNALGRLADANVAVELLMTGDLTRARILAAELEGLNAQRKLLTEQVMQAAEAQLERDPSLLEQSVLVVNHPAWHAGVIGLVAGRLAERYNRPAVVIAEPPGQLARGSARSVPGCDITAALAVHERLLGEYGGHPMAAGFSITPEQIAALRSALSRTVAGLLGQTPRRPTLQIDGYLRLGELSLDLVEQLERLAPFGPGNEPLTLASRNLRVVRESVVGRNDEHLQLVVEGEGGTVQKVIWWHGATLSSDRAPLPAGRFDLAYTVRASDYRGQRDLQVEWIDIRPLEQPAALPEAPLRLQVIDYRGVPDPESALDTRRLEEPPQVWAEADDRAALGARHRYELVDSPSLAIWTTPPGPGELQAALAQSAPETLILVGLDPGLDRPEAFLARLAGLVKHVLKTREGRASIADLAAATAHREATVRAGLDWLAARGYLELHEDTPGALRLGRGQGATRRSELERTALRLEALLEETAAYRAYFARMPKDALATRTAPASRP
jgi:single-stranded-DNA-specific exonuclease